MLHAFNQTEEPNVTSHSDINKQPYSCLHACTSELNVPCFHWTLHICSMMLYELSVINRVVIYCFRVCQFAQTIFYPSV